MAIAVDYFEHNLKQKGSSYSRPREMILKVLVTHPKLLSADDIYMLLKTEDPSIGIATVYRTLELLFRLELICRVNMGTEKSMYMLSPNCREELSSFLVCERCGRVVLNNPCLKSAIKVRMKDDAQDNIYKNCKLKINNFQVFFTGLCDRCSSL